MSHHPTLSPSAFPKLNLCIQFFPDPVVGEAAERGTELHQQLQLMHEKGVPCKDEGAVAAYSRVTAYVADIRGCESKLQYYKDGLSETNFGTADIWGYTDGELILCDYKSGRLSDPSSYHEQMAMYALMLMEKTGESSCRSIIIGIDTGKDYETHWDLLPTKALIDGIIDRVVAKAEPPQENQYCTWCVKRTTCPVKVGPAEKAMTLVDNTPVKLTKEWITESPANAGTALIMLEAIQDMFEALKVKELVKDAITAGAQVKGWSIQTRKGSERVDTKAIKARWSEFTSDPLPVTISAPTVSLVRKESGR